MYGNSVGEVRSEARFRFQIARRILAYILDRVEEGKFSLKKLPSPAVPADSGGRYISERGCVFIGNSSLGRFGFWSFRKETLSLPQFMACVGLSLTVNLHPSICVAP